MARRGRRGTRATPRPDQKEEVRPAPTQPFGNTTVGDLGPEQIIALRRVAISRMLKRSF